MKKNAKEKDLEYIRQVCVASYQVFLGIAAITFFSPLDFGKIVVIVFNLILALVFFMLGWRKFR